MKVLVSAYACEPGRGSEPGAGWIWAMAAANCADVWVITRSNNRDVIEAVTKGSNGRHPNFVYVDLPAWARFWKRGGRGVRVYYTLWQLAAALRTRQLEQQMEFDIAHHVTFANMWLPALACVSRAPFVLGPIGGGPAVPVRMYPALGIRGAAREVWLRAVRALNRWNPLVRLAWRRASLIIVQNEETRSALPRKWRHKTTLRPNAGVAQSLANMRAEKSNTPVLGSAGRLIPWKGFAVALYAMRELPAWRLRVFGGGADLRRLERLAAKLGVDARVEFVEHLPQQCLWAALASCHVFLLPSLRDDSPLVCAEARSLGLPVVAFDQGGPAAFARSEPDGFELVPMTGSVRECASRLAAAALAASVHPARLADSSAGFGPEMLERDLRDIYAIARDGGSEIPGELGSYARRHSGAVA